MAQGVLSVLRCFGNFIKLNKAFAQSCFGLFERCMKHRGCFQELLLLHQGSPKYYEEDGHDVQRF